MSKEKNKEKKSGANKEAAVHLQLDKTYIAKLTGTLLGLTAATALLLGIVNYVTAPVIAAAEEEKKAAAMEQVLQADEYPAVEGFSADGVTVTTGAGSATVTALYTATAGGADVGYVAEVTTNGFGGAISMVVGVDLEGYVTGVSVVDHGETQGVGSKVVGNQAVLDQLVGMTGEITVKTGDNKFDGVSGATVSSKAVTAGVNAVLSVVSGLA